MVKLGDTLKPLGEFPVAESVDISIDINGTEKSIQQAYDDGDLSGGGSSIQIDVMPIPSSEYEDKIVQYIGESGTYKNGYFYKCQAVEGSSPTQYEWVEQEVQESKDSTPHWSGTRAEYDEIKDTLEVGTYVSITDDYENEVIQWNIMPDANSDYFKKIVQYVGETTEDYINGYFYKCVVVEGSDPYIYEWIPSPTQSMIADSIEYVESLPTRENIKDVIYGIKEESGLYETVKIHTPLDYTFEQVLELWSRYFNITQVNSTTYSVEVYSDLYMTRNAWSNHYSKAEGTLNVMNISTNGIVLEFGTISANNMTNILDYTFIFKSSHFPRMNYYAGDSEKKICTLLNENISNFIMRSETPMPIPNNYKDGDIVLYTGEDTHYFKKMHQYEWKETYESRVYQLTLTRSGESSYYIYKICEHYIDVGSHVYVYGTDGNLERKGIITAINGTNVTVYSNASSETYVGWAVNDVATTAKVCDWFEISGNSVKYTNEDIYAHYDDYESDAVVVYTGDESTSLEKGHHYQKYANKDVSAYFLQVYGNSEHTTSTSYYILKPEVKVGTILYYNDDGTYAVRKRCTYIDGDTYKWYDYELNIVMTSVYGINISNHAETIAINGWVDIGGGGGDGNSIFYGTMDEWNALSADEKKQYEYMADDDEDNDEPVTGVITRNTSNTSGMQEAYLKRIGKTVLLHCNLTDCVLPANEITTYATVQDGFRPDSSLQWAMLDLDFTIEGLRGWITNSGNIQLLSPVATTSSIRIQSMYFTD